MTRLRMILMGFLLLAVGCAQQEGDGVAPVEKARNVRALVLRGGGQIEQLMEIAGPVTPLRGTDLAAEGAGTVVALPVAKGAAVAAGEAVVVQDRVALAAEMEAAKADLKVREFDHEKLVQLFDAGKISRFELLQAERDLAQARSRLKTATHLHARAAISAPFAGLLVDRYIELGQYVLPGQKVARVIARDTLKLTGYLTDLQVAQAMLESTVEGQAAAEETFRVRSAMLEAGAATPTEVLDAEIAQRRAELAALDAHIAAHVAEAKVRYVAHQD